jgi:hypothetical protein
MDATLQERLILDDIRARTGLSFVILEGIDTRQEAIATAVLPILVEWFPKLPARNYRHAIYHRMITPYAYPYLDKLISWWETEQYDEARACLTQALAELARPADAERLWKLCQTHAPFPFQYMLMAKLARFPSTEREVKAALVAALENASLRPGDLQFISQVSDPRIRQWFQGQVDSPNRYVRIIAKRAVKRGRRLPSGVELAGGPPDRRLEIFSTEVDLHDVAPLLRQIAEEFDLKMPGTVRKPAFLSSVDIDQWLVAHVATRQGQPASIWLRLEDIDTVEVVVTGSAEHSASRP